MESTVKIGAVVLYLAILMGIGVVASRRMKNVRDYFAAGKGLGYLSVAFSARATGESAWLLLGLTGMGAALGVKAFWVVLGELLGVMGAWFLMSRRFKRLTNRYDSITVPDYLESRFRDEKSQTIRKVAAIALTVFVTIYVSAQIDATGKAFESEQFLGWGYYPGVFIGIGVVLVYIMAGGFLAVAWSDVFQGALMVAGLVLLPIVGLFWAGGWGEVTAGLTAIDPNLMSWHGPLPDGESSWSTTTVLEIVGLSLIGLGFLGSPQIFVRFIALRDEKEIRMGSAVAIVWTILADGGAVLVGLVGRHLLTGPGQGVEDVLGTGAENVLPMLVDHVMPLILVGIYIAIVLSAVMSTVDSLLVVAGSALVRDYYQKVRNPDIPDDQLVGLSRRATFAIAVVALLISITVALTTEERTVFWFVIFGWSGIAATFCPTLILSMFWSGMTKKGAIAAMITGFTAVPFFKFAGPELGDAGPYFDALSELPPSFAVSFLVGVLVSWRDPDKPDPEQLARDLELRAPEGEQEPSH